MYKYVTDAENFEVYGQTNPPAYPIEEIDTIPIYIVSPTRDTLASRQDVQWLYETLKPNYKDTELVYALLEGGHSSPLQAKDMYEWIEAVQPFIGRHI